MRRETLFCGLVCVCLTGVVVVTSDVLFTRWEYSGGLRVVNVDQQIPEQTRVHCAIRCSEFTGCVSFNWHFSGLCELNTKPMDFYTSYLVEATGWTLYERGICGLGFIVGKHCVLHPRIGKNWIESQEICNAGQANLSQVFDTNENEKLNTELLRVYPNVTELAGFFWLGLKKKNTENVWLNDVPAAAGFEQYVPNTAAHDCFGTTKFEGTWLLWMPEPCTAAWSSVCERRDVIL